MTYNFIGGKWEEVELGERNRILFRRGRNIGGKWEEVELGRGTGYFFRRKKYWRQMGGRQREGAQNFGNPWDVNVSEGGMLEKILGRGGSGEGKLYREILEWKGTSARQTTGFI